MELLMRTWAEIDLDNLTHNYEVIRAHVPAGTKFTGVVKADAYGHGAVPVSRHLAELGAEYLAVSNLEEAIQLRRAGIELPILILGYTPPQYGPLLAENHITQEVNCIEFARMLSEAMAGAGGRLKVHIKLDTGMSRLGFFAYGRPETLAEMTELSRLPGLEIEGVFAHFSVADSNSAADVAYTRMQYNRFMELLGQMKAVGIEPEIRHHANSGATIRYPEYALDMVRPGIATYGLEPSMDLRGEMDLRPVMSLRSTVEAIRPFPEQVPISYGRTYTTLSPTLVAVVPIGYADGLLRRYSNQIMFLLHGRRVPVIGRICMDMCMIDITGVSDVKVGDEVTIFGRDGATEITCDDLAYKADTISYEILCNINKRVPRIYFQDGKRTEVLQYIV